MSEQDDAPKPWPFVEAARPAFAMPRTSHPPRALERFAQEQRDHQYRTQQQKGWMGA